MSANTESQTNHIFSRFLKTPEKSTITTGDFSLQVPVEPARLQDRLYQQFCLPIRPRCENSLNVQSSLALSGENVFLASLVSVV